MSFLVNGTKFWPNHYYRDDNLARRVLYAGLKGNPVLVTGLRRIGKSWFLRRFEQIFTAKAMRHFAEDGSPSESPLEEMLPRTISVLDGGVEDLGALVDHVLGLKDPGHLLAIDELEKVVAAAQLPLLERILAYRPLVLVAAPGVHELARAQSPKLAKFFEDCITHVLGPLSMSERRALIFQTCDAGEGLSAKHEALALGREWGGHPLVLQQVGELIRANPKVKFPALVGLVHAKLNSASRYAESLCRTGLSTAQRDVLDRVARGEPVAKEDSTATELHLHGAILPKKGKGWALENVVLQRYFDGLPDAKSVNGEPAPKPESAPAAPRKPKAPTRVFTWIHLSDLHFGAGTTGYRFDHKAVMRAIERDLAANAPRPVDRIFGTGDIAFSARPDEYTEARSWFERIAKAAGVGLDCLRFVPGNHDVDRQVVKKSPLLRSAHHAARERRVELDDLLADRDARAVLVAKLEPYQRFVSTFAGHPTPIENGIDWVEILDAGAAGHGSIRIAGLSTVWTSDELDGRDEGGKGFVRNLVLAHGPLDHLTGEAIAAELTLLLTHHPPEWIALRADGVDLLSRELARLPHIHLSGHVHDASAGSTKRHGRAGHSLWYVAGAAHSDPSEAAKHGYAWGAVRYDPSREGWQAGWAPRAYVNGAMCADSTGRELDGDDFAWEDIDCRWPAPG